MVKSNEYFIPLGDNIDVAAEIEKLQKELDYTKGFLKSVERKLSNERFVNNAPEQVVVNEKNKMADAKAKISILATKIKDLASA
jgi:valyl-tRNA synthetase